MGIENLAVFSDETQDPYVTKPDDEDSEEEDDFNLLPTDNLIAVGHVEGDAAILEIYGIVSYLACLTAFFVIEFWIFSTVYNAEEAHLYVHHETFLPSLPLCMEWIDFNPTETAPGIFFF